MNSFFDWCVNVQAEHFRCRCDKDELFCGARWIERITKFIFLRKMFRLKFWMDIETDDIHDKRSSARRNKLAIIDRPTVSTHALLFPLFASFLKESANSRLNILSRHTLSSIVSFIVFLSGTETIQMNIKMLQINYSRTRTLENRVLDGNNRSIEEIQQYCIQLQSLYASI